MLNLKYFTIDEFKCSHTGLVFMDDFFLLLLDELRAACGFPFVITSGYRSPTHPVEARKSTPGTHAKGIAADIATASSEARYAIISNAMRLGCTGVGVANTFVHLDVRDTTPVVWTYN